MESTQEKHKPLAQDQARAVEWAQALCPIEDPSAPVSLSDFRSPYHAQLAFAVCKSHIPRYRMGGMDD